MEYYNIMYVKFQILAALVREYNYLYGLSTSIVFYRSKKNDMCIRARIRERGSEHLAILNKSNNKEKSL
jgi:hypothetical protein